MEKLLVEFTYSFFVLGVVEMINILDDGFVLLVEEFFGASGVSENNSKRTV